MSELYRINKSTLDDIGSALREANNTTEKFAVSSIGDKIRELAGGGGGENKLAKLIERSVTEITEADLQGVTNIAGYVFYTYTNLKKITLPTSITEIGPYAFYGCIGLEEFIIPTSITKIGNYAFSQCKNIRPIILDLEHWCTVYIASQESNPAYGGGASTGSNVYLGDTLLTNVIIPESITHILSNTFAYWKSLESVEINKNVTKIDSFPFYRCKNISKIVVKAETPPTINTSSFYDIPTACRIEVPAASVETYKSATNWSAIADKIYAIEE